MIPESCFVVVFVFVCGGGGGGGVEREHFLGKGECEMVGNGEGMVVLSIFFPSQ